MDKKKYGVALIGCGSMGAAHLDEICYMENVTVQCVCDTQKERAEYFARHYHAVTAVTDYQDAVSDPVVDIVIIATYPSSHPDILEACLNAGKHVLCEKPIARNLQDGERIMRLIEQHPECKVLVGYILRHNQTFQKVAEMIHDGAIGKPIVMRMAQNHHTMNWEKYLHLISETSPIVDCGVHYIDIMQWFTGAKVTEVSAIGARTEADVKKSDYNYGLLTARFSDGSVGYYEAGWGNTMAANNLKEFVGPKGRITITLKDFRSENQEEGDLIEYYQYPEKRYNIINNLCKRKPTGAQLQALIDMIEKGSEPSPTMEEVWSSFNIVLEADRVIREMHLPGVINMKDGE